MKKYGAVDVDMRDITRTNVLNFMNTYSMGHQIHLVKEEYPGAEFFKQEGID